MSFLFFKKKHVHAYTINKINGKQIDEDTGEFFFEQFCLECGDRFPVYMMGHLTVLPPRPVPTMPEAPKSPTNRRRLNTHCRKGHRLTRENTIVFKNGERRCRTCRTKWQSDYRNLRSARTIDIVYVDSPLFPLPAVPTNTGAKKKTTRPAGSRRPRRTKK